MCAEGYKEHHLLQNDKDLTDANSTENLSMRSTATEHNLTLKNFLSAKQNVFIDYYTDIRSSLSVIYKKYRHWRGVFALKVVDKHEYYLIESNNIGEAIEELSSSNFHAELSIPELLVRLVQYSLSSLHLLILEKHSSDCKVDLKLSKKYDESLLKFSPNISKLIAEVTKINAESVCSCDSIHRSLFRGSESFHEQTNHSTDEVTFIDSHDKLKSKSNDFHEAPLNQDEEEKSSIIDLPSTNASSLLTNKRAAAADSPNKQNSTVEVPTQLSSSRVAKENTTKCQSSQTYTSGGRKVTSNEDVESLKRQTRFKIQPD